MQYKHQFWYDRELHKKKTAGRKYKFVLIPECPAAPTLHPGVDDKENVSRPLALNHQELIRMGESTIVFLQKENKSQAGYVCPRTLFLTTPNETDKRYREHLLKNYITKIMSEKQHALEIHIAAHGDQNAIGATAIGTVDCDLRYTVERFAETFDMFIAGHSGELYEALQTKPIHIVFHSCNSAYADTDEKMDKKARDALIRDTTFIGRFAKLLKAEGYTQLTVSGFRGFYSHLTSGSASVVSSTPHSLESYDANKSKFTIHPNGQVIEPVRYDFPVKFEHANVTRLQQQPVLQSKDNGGSVLRLGQF